MSGFLIQSSGYYEIPEPEMKQILDDTYYRMFRATLSREGVHVYHCNIDTNYNPPVKKISHWVPHIGAEKGLYECSKCQWVSPKLEKEPEDEYMNYCPCCGAEIDFDWEDEETENDDRQHRPY